MKNTAPLDRRLRFVELLQQPGALIVPGAYDALSAMLIERAGFDAAYIGSFATSASSWGLPDVGLLTLSDLTDAARRVTSATSLPVLADGEAGFFDAANIWRTVRAFEDAGTVGIHIEDNLGGKHSNAPAGLAPAEQTTQRIRAAVDARTDENFQIIARSDALWVDGDLEGCVNRLRRYVEAGATAVFVPGITADQLRSIRGEFAVPFMVLADLVDHDGMNPPAAISEFESAGADLVVLFYQLLGAAAKGVEQALQAILSTGAIVGPEHVKAIGEFESNMGYDDYSARVTRYREVPVG